MFLQIIFFLYFKFDISNETKKFQNCANSNVDLGVEIEDSVELRPANAKGRSGVSRNDSGFYSFPIEHPAVSPRTMGEGVRHTSSK